MSLTTTSPENSRLPDIDARLQEAQAKTWTAVHKIAASLTPGMREDEAIKLAQKTLVGMGCEKFWHRCHVRFGKSTALSYDDPYQNSVLGPDDIFYVDIGPVWDGIEGDAGATFATGQASRYEKIRADVRAVFEAVRVHWLETKANGTALYRFAEAEAERRGWVLAPGYVRGHRLAEFPHSFHSKLHLDQVDFCPAPLRWMLEVHICDPKLEFGAFYEELLS